MLDFNKIDELISQKYISVQKHPTLDLRILNYTPKCQFEKNWVPETLACRGLIINSKNEIIARPFEKFFNYEEVLDKIPNEQFEVFEKMDGSMIIVTKYNGELVVASRGSFTSDHAKKATELLNTKYKAFRDAFTANTPYTAILEVIFPAGRIVVDYGSEEKLVLLAMYNTKSGEEVPYNVMRKLHVEYIDVVPKYDGLKDFKSIRALNLDNKEGFVIRFENGFRMKLKFADYCRLHRIVTGVSSRTIWEYLKEGKSLDELIEKVPDEFYNFVKMTADELISEFVRNSRIVETSYNSIISSLPKTFTQKEFAEKVFKEYKTYSGLLFARNMGKDLTEAIWKRIKPEYSQPFNKI